MSRVFINYRREDTSGHAGCLYDDLTEALGPDQVFIDIDRLYPGADWAESIDAALASTGILLTLIGQHWIDASDEDGRRRLEDPDDVLRREIATALARRVRVIPVLVQGAGMPRADDLPEDLKPLTRRHAIELSDGRWRYDVGRLVEALNLALGQGEARVAPPESVASPGLGPPAQPSGASAAAASHPVAAPAGQRPAPPAQPAPQPQPEVLSEGRYVLQSLIGFGVYGPAQGEMWLTRTAPDRFAFRSVIVTMTGRVDSQGEIWHSGGRWFVATTASTYPLLTAYGAVPNDLTRQGSTVTFVSQLGTVTWAQQ